MKREEIFESIVKKLKEKHEKIDLEISQETILANGENNSLDLTSIEIVEFIVEVEELFDVIIDFDIVYETIGDIVLDVERLMKRGNCDEQYQE